MKHEDRAKLWQRCSPQTCNDNPAEETFFATSQQSLNRHDSNQTESRAVQEFTRSDRLVMTLAAIALAAMSSGCVHRRVTVRTSPPGAQVVVGGREIGFSPASFDITWYGTEEVTLLKDGYEIETQYVRIPRPWYQVPPFDFISDHFLPFRVKDQHDFSFQLTPRSLVPRSDLVERGNAFRSESQLGQ